MIFRRTFHFVALLIASWCVMTTTHEMGHIVCGLATGATLRSCDVLPWHLPYSIFEPDPWPLITLWGGPLLGVLVPMAFAACVRRHWSNFIAYFCMLANGSYIAAAWGSSDSLLDTPKLLEHGASHIGIGLYCLLTLGFGYFGFRKHCAGMFATPAVNAEPVVVESPSS